MSRSISYLLKIWIFIFLAQLALGSAAFRPVPRGAKELGTLGISELINVSPSNGSIPALLEKRMDEQAGQQTTIPEDPLRRWMPGVETWCAFDPYPNTLTKAQVRGYVQEKYSELVTLPEFRSTGGTTILAGLYIPCMGIFYGTIPHGGTLAGVELDATGSFTIQAKLDAPCLWNTIGGRRNLQGGTTLYHAEDMACYMMEWTFKKVLGLVFDSSNTYPTGSYITAYGRYGSWDTDEGIKEACGQGDPKGTQAMPFGATIDPTCTEAMSELGIDIKNN